MQGAGVSVTTQRVGGHAAADASGRSACCGRCKWVCRSVWMPAGAVVCGVGLEQGSLACRLAGWAGTVRGSWR